MYNINCSCISEVMTTEILFYNTNNRTLTLHRFTCSCKHRAIKISL